jgi:hypothetical protein
MFAMRLNKSLIRNFQAHAAQGSHKRCVAIIAEMEVLLSRVIFLPFCFCAHNPIPTTRNHAHSTAWHAPLFSCQFATATKFLLVHLL